MKVQEISEGAYFVAEDWDQTIANGHRGYSNQIIATQENVEPSDHNDVETVENELPEGKWG